MGSGSIHSPGTVWAFGFSSPNLLPQVFSRSSSLRGVEWVHGLFLFPPCFRENVVVTGKIGSLCSLDNLLQKNVIVLFFGNQISKFEKRAIFDRLFTFSSHQGKVTKIPSAQISLTFIHIVCSPYWLFLPYQFWKKYEFIRYGFSLVWVLVLILIRATLEQSINNKMVSKNLSWNVYYWYVLTQMKNS